MNHENNTEHASQLNRQQWEPAGVVSVMEDDKTPKYGEGTFKNAKGGMLTLEVKEAFHNKGIMEGQENSNPGLQ